MQNYYPILVLIVIGSAFFLNKKLNENRLRIDETFAKTEAIELKINKLLNLDTTKQDNSENKGIELGFIGKGVVNNLKDK